VKLKIVKHIFFLVFFTAVFTAPAQDRFAVIEARLSELSKITPGLNDKVELSVNGVTIQDFIRGIATTSNLNVSVDQNLNTKIYNNFSNAPVTDVLMFLCRKYDLDITFIGNIMSVSQYVQPLNNTYTPKTLKIAYDKANDALSLDLSNDSLALVAKAITKISQKNVVFSPELQGKMVSGFIQSMPFNAALDKLAFSNDLKVTPTNDNFFLIEKLQVAGGPNPNNSRGGNSGSYSSSQGLNIKSDGNKKLSIDAMNVPIADVLKAVTSELKINFFLLDEPKGNTSLNIKNASYDEFLDYLFNGTEYTFKKEGEIYLIGDRNLEGIRSTKVIPLQYRAIDKVIDFIPPDLKKGIDVKAFVELNSLIASGSLPRIEELKNFIRDIDRIVPVISIEVMIVDISNSHTVSTGIKAGLGDKPAITGGDLYPTLDLTLGAGAINSVIDGINGTGIVNLGKVTPNFYVRLQLMEQNGDLKISSTPLVSTMNGHEAKMGNSEVRYYVENNSNVIATQNTTTINTQVFKPLTAEFALTITPFVSGDEQITMDIAFKQSTFTAQTTGANGPYGTKSRDFKSLIRVKNQEMIMLGGLSEEVNDENSSGVPVLSRIPVIKWIFSSRNKKKSQNKLTIFIKPTVIY
jgi:type IV pilus assembly protein PilQ